MVYGGQSLWWRSGFDARQIVQYNIERDRSRVNRYGVIDCDGVVDGDGYFEWTLNWNHGHGDSYFHKLGQFHQPSVTTD